MSGKTEIVTATVGGQTWTAWKRVMIRASYKEAARSFELEIAAERGGAQTNALFALFAPVEIKATGDLVLSGYIDKRRPRVSAETAEMTISGRSKGQDAIDSSAKHETGDFKQKTPVEIGNAIAPPGVTFKSDIDLDKVDYHLTPGETAFRAVEKLARAQGATLTGDADGSIRITNASKGPKKHAGGLFHPGNIESASADHDGSNRHSEYRVVGQKPKGTGADALRLEGIARDAGVTRDRVLIVVHDDDADKERLKKRAKNRRNRAAGNGLKASVTVATWRDEAGQLWTPGQTVWTESEFLGLAQDMLIESVTLSQEAEGKGTQAQIELVDPRAHQGKAGKGAKSSKAWKQDSSEATDNVE